MIRSCICRAARRRSRGAAGRSTSTPDRGAVPGGDWDREEGVHLRDERPLAALGAAADGLAARRLATHPCRIVDGHRLARFAVSPGNDVAAVHVERLHDPWDDEDVGRLLRPARVDIRARMGAPPCLRQLACSARFSGMRSTRAFAIRRMGAAHGSWISSRHARVGASSSSRPRARSGSASRALLRSTALGLGLGIADLRCPVTLS